METTEIAITSDNTGQLWNCSVWDVYSATNLMSYKGGGAAGPRCLSLLGQDFIVSTNKTEPLLHIWPLNSQQEVKGQRFVLPERASALAFSPNGCYCVIGIAEKIYVWQLASGSLLVIVSKHYQTVTNIKFCDDGSHFVSAGDDGMILVWNLMNLISIPGTWTLDSNLEPLYIFSDHTLPVTDMYIGKGGIRSRLVTVSIDRTCKIYDLSHGELLLNVVFEKCLSAVTMDLMEMNLFVGNVEGEIKQICITNPPRTRECHANDKNETITFSAHTETINCLSCSVDGETLISGSNDKKVNVWHIPSGQKVNSIPHKGAITNAFFTIVPENMFIEEFKPTIILRPLKRTIDFDSEISIMTTKKNNFWRIDNVDPDNLVNHSDSTDVSENTDIEKLQQEIEALKRNNLDLHKFCIENLIKNAKTSA